MVELYILLCLHFAVTYYINNCFDSCMDILGIFIRECMHLKIQYNGQLPLAGQIHAYVCICCSSIIPMYIHAQYMSCSIYRSIFICTCMDPYACASYSHPSVYVHMHASNHGQEGLNQLPLTFGWPCFYAWPWYEWTWMYTRPWAS